jgi:type II secretory pathway pseudopilin PulG
MDPNGGINPSSPRLDNSVPQPNQPIQQPVMTAPVTAPVLESPVADQVNPVVLPPSNIMDLPQTSPDMGAAPQKGGTLKKVLLGLLVVMIVSGLAGGAYFLGYSAGKSKGRNLADAEYQRKQAQAQQEEQTDTDASDTPTEETTAELDLSDLKDPKYVDETLEGQTGKQLDSSDGFVLKVVNIERNFKAEDPNYKLDSSKELVKVNFLIGNKAKDKAKDIGNFSFRLENSVNAQLTPENITEYTDKFDTVKLEPGSQSKGSIVYAVNKDEKPLKFIREQRYRISSENREVTIRTVITVAK